VRSGNSRAGQLSVAINQAWMRRANPHSYAVVSADDGNQVQELTQVMQSADQACQVLAYRRQPIPSAEKRGTPHASFFDVRQISGHVSALPGVRSCETVGVKKIRTAKITREQHCVR